MTRSHTKTAVKSSGEPKPMGRPSSYTPERGNKVAALYAQGVSKDNIARLKWAPSVPTISRWERNHEDFRAALAHARRSKGEYHAEEAGKALEVDLGAIEPKLASATVNLAGKKSDYHKWLAGCMDRDTYSDRGTPVEAGGASTIVIFNGLVAPEAVSAALPEDATVVSTRALPAPPCGHQGSDGGDGGEGD